MKNFSSIIKIITAFLFLVWAVFSSIDVYNSVGYGPTTGNFINDIILKFIGLLIPLVGIFILVYFGSRLFWLKFYTATPMENKRLIIVSVLCVASAVYGILSSIGIFFLVALPILTLISKIYRSETVS